MKEYEKWYAERQEKLEKGYFDYLKFASISADPSHKKDVEACGAHLEKMMQESHLQTEKWETSGSPAFFGCSENIPGAPTILFYGHYDVQPVDPIELWHHDPFDPKLEGREVFARGASDNKGQSYYFLKAMQAYLELNKQKKVNIKVLIEGEEEIGSPNLSLLLKEKKEELKCDYVLVVDVELPEKGVPGVTLGVRGCVSLEVVIKNANHDLHSGIHGNLALNPNKALVRLLAEMWDEEGSIAIPHFYDEVEPPSKTMLSHLDEHFSEEEYKKAFGVSLLDSEKGFSPQISNWMRPTLELVGIRGGYGGEGMKTIIPNEAIAKISCRIVPHQTPEKVCQVVKEFLLSKAPKGMDIEVHFHEGKGAAVQADPTLPLVQVLEKAYEKVFDLPALKILCGASIPISADMQKELNAPVLFIGMGQGDDHIHAPNEHFGLDRLEKGYYVITELLENLSDL